MPTPSSEAFDSFAPSERETRRQRVLSVDLGDLKERWFDWCHARGVSPSQATREVVAKLTNADADANQPPPPAAELRNVPDAARVRCELRFSKSEFDLVQQHADAFGLNPQKWLVSLVRTHVSKAPQLAPDAQKLLGESNYQLLKIGRNLNQLARTLSTQSDDAAAHLTAERLLQMRQLLQQHVELAARVIESSNERWKLKV